MRLLVTGGAGFIGSEFVRQVIDRTGHEVVNVDGLSYAGDTGRLKSVAENSRYSFIKADLSEEKDYSLLPEGVDVVVHFAAETHVDRSLLSSKEFFLSNSVATQLLTDWAVKNDVKRFVLVSTDEVYGSVDSGSFSEEDRINPTNPYSVSKAASELLAINARRHKGLDLVISRGSNTYGPWQYPEKLIPFFISRLQKDEAVPVYGDGGNVRDWLHVSDHAEAIYFLLEKGESGGIYNIPGSEELTNLEVTKRLLSKLGKPESLIQFVTDREGHDRRYSLNGTKVKKLGWEAKRSFDDSFDAAVDWYCSNAEWLDTIRKKNEEYKAYIRAQYEARIGG